MIILRDEYTRQPLALFTHEQALAFENLCLRIAAELLPPPVCPLDSLCSACFDRTKYYYSKIISQIIFERETIASQLIENPGQMSIEEQRNPNSSADDLVDDLTVLWAEHETLRSRIRGAWPSTAQQIFTAGQKAAQTHLSALESDDPSVSRRLTTAHFISLFDANHWLTYFEKAAAEAHPVDLPPAVREVIFALIDRHTALQMEIEYLKMTFSTD